MVEAVKAWFLLREADIEFDEQRIPLDTDDTAQQIAEFSPAGRVPVLLLDDIAVWDTLAIAETVAERWPDRALWPTDATARAKLAEDRDEPVFESFDALLAEGIEPTRVFRYWSGDDTDASIVIDEQGRISAWREWQHRDDERDWADYVRGPTR